MRKVRNNISSEHGGEWMGAWARAGGDSRRRQASQIGQVDRLICQCELRTGKHMDERVCACVSRGEGRGRPGIVHTLGQAGFVSACKSGVSDTW